MAFTPPEDTVPEQWSTAVTALTSAPSQNWVAPFLDLLPAAGMSISTIGLVFAAETLIASDRVAARLDESQFDLGEGPSWDCVNRGLPVLESDVPSNGHGSWPALSDSVAGQGVRGMFAFPLLLGSIGIGAITLYALDLCTLTGTEIARVQALAGSVTHLVLHRSIAQAGVPMESEQENPHSRRVVHQATGAVIAQLGIPADDALLVLQGRAFAENRPVRAVAEDVIARRVVFTRQYDGIEDTP
jgi:hypothetical protein